jgi:hypothetical protein
VNIAIQKNMRMIAISDHDSIDGIKIARMRAGDNISIVSAVEFNTEVGKEDVHILGYGFDENDAGLIDVIKQRRNDRSIRAKKMIERLNDLNINDISFNDLCEIARDGAIGRPHVAKALVMKGHFDSIGDAFSKYLAKGRPVYVPRAPFTPVEAIDIIHESGGIAVLAHPGKLGDPNRIINMLIKNGLDGIEVYHTDHSVNVTKRMYDFARQHNLFMTVGSDSHGPMIRNVEIGSVNAPDDVIEKIINRF